MLVAFGTLLGGIGLFLIGMLHLTEGLKQSAGEKLEEILNRSTQTKARGFSSGFALTSLVQSSSVVTVATIGFVNAGLLSMGQAVWVVFGSNVGTTMTSWIVALIGFKIKVEIFALPLVGLGAFLHILSPNVRLRALGGAIAGFGLLFVGLDLLQSSLTDYKGKFDILQAADFDTYHVLLLLGMGFLLTVIMQSSSAAMAMILTLVNAELIPLSLGAAAVIGANVGTTSTAVLATIGATPNAKRVAWAHVLFNLIAGIAALLLLPLVTEVFSIAYEKKLAGGNAAFWLAIYHSLFNIIGVLLMIPFEPRITHFLESRFRLRETEVYRLRYLDKTIVDVPAIALQATLNELKELYQLIAKDTSSFSTLPNPDNLKSLEGLLTKMDNFLIQVLRQPMSANYATLLSDALKCSQHLSNVLQTYQHLTSRAHQPSHPKLKNELVPLQNSYQKMMGTISQSQDVASIHPVVTELTGLAEKLEVDILKLTQEADILDKDINITLDWVSLLHRSARQWDKALGRIAVLETSLGPQVAETEKLVDPSET